MEEIHNDESTPPDSHDSANAGGPDWEFLGKGEQSETPSESGLGDKGPSSGVVASQMADEHAGRADTTPAPEPQTASERAGAPSQGSGAKNLVAAAVVAALVGGGAGGAIGYAVANNDGSSSNTYQIVTSNEASTPATIGTSVSIPALVNRVISSVVSIDSSGGGSEDQGTGFIITSGGLVMTNNHVIANAASGGTITVTISRTTQARPAVLVGRDPANDMALLQIKGASGLQPVTFGNSDLAPVGTGVVAIGNALGLAAGTPTVTQGIISAKGRTVTAGDSNSSTTETLYNMLQTDAAINPGNSGGPLLDSFGHVIGMNTAVAGSNADGSSSQNIGFAIPSNHIRSLLPTLIKGGSAKPHAHLGVVVTTVTPEFKSQYGLTPSTGALVLQVQPSSAAASAGLQQGDVIVQIDGQTITTADQLTSQIQKASPGSTIQVTYYRGTTQSTVPITLGSSS